MGTETVIVLNHQSPLLLPPEKKDTGQLQTSHELSSKKFGLTLHEIGPAILKSLQKSMRRKVK